MADDHHDGSGDPGTTKRNEHHDVLESPLVMKDQGIEDTMVVENVNGGGASVGDQGDPEVADDPDASGKEGDGDVLDNNGHQGDILDAQAQPVPPKRRSSVKNYSSYDHDSLVNSLREPGNFSSQELDEIAKALKKQIRQIFNLLAENKVRKAHSHKKKVYHPETAAEVLVLFGGRSSPGPLGCLPEDFPEDVHSWAVSDPPTLPRTDSNNPNEVLPWVVLRLWDGSSVSRIRDDAVGMISGYSGPLDTVKKRQYYLRLHTNWGSRTKTPVISCTSHISQVARYWCFPRFNHRCPSKILESKLSVINVHAVQAAGYPVLRLKDEMEYYMVEPKCNNSDHEEEYLIPYRIPPDAIMTTFSWRFIRQWMDFKGEDHEGWYREFVIPLALAHEEVRQAKIKANITSMGFETALIVKVEKLSLDELVEYFTAPLNQLQKSLAILNATDQPDSQEHAAIEEESTTLFHSPTVSNDSV
ncbi:hypothetical protein NHQ30_003167 [Ciborinia camelliae]|nr:hypothetical protein NHQ30_003167 [Ciborinia camelliae]